MPLYNTSDPQWRTPPRDDTPRGQLERMIEDAIDLLLHLDGDEDPDLEDNGDLEDDRENDLEQDNADLEDDDPLEADDEDRCNAHDDIGTLGQWDCTPGGSYTGAQLRHGIVSDGGPGDLEDAEDDGEDRCEAFDDIGTSGREAERFFTKAKHGLGAGDPEDAEWGYETRASFGRRHVNQFTDALEERVRSVLIPEVPIENLVAGRGRPGGAR